MLCLRDLSAFICVNYECMMYVYLCLLTVQGTECEEELLKHGVWCMCVCVCWCMCVCVCWWCRALTVRRSYWDTFRCLSHVRDFSYTNCRRGMSVTITFHSLLQFCDLALWPHWKQQRHLTVYLCGQTEWVGSNCKHGETFILLYIALLLYCFAGSILLHHCFLLLFTLIISVKKQ